MIEFDNIDSQRDLAKNRMVLLDNGSKMFIRQADDGYNFWTIHAEKGKVAEAISGNYTSFDSALLALRNYLSKKADRAISEVHQGFGIKTNGQGQLIQGT